MDWLNINNKSSFFPKSAIVFTLLLLLPQKLEKHSRQTAMKMKILQKKNKKNFPLPVVCFCFSNWFCNYSMFVTVKMLVSKGSSDKICGRPASPSERERWKNNHRTGSLLFKVTWDAGTLSCHHLAHLIVTQKPFSHRISTYNQKTFICFKCFQLSGMIRITTTCTVSCRTGLKFGRLSLMLMLLHSTGLHSQSGVCMFSTERSIHPALKTHTA